MLANAVLRIAWVIAVAGAGAGLTRGLWLTTYFSLTPQAQADAERGVLWLWGATAVLILLAWAAWQLWSAASWAVMSLVAAGPVCLLVEGLGWLPLIALLAVVPMLWVGATGGAFARPRAPGGD